MAAARRIAVVGLGGLAFVLALLVAVVFVLTATDWGREHVRRLALSRLDPAVDGEVEIARLEGSLLDEVRLIGVSMIDSAGRPFLRADTIEAGYSLHGLLSKRIRLHDVRFVDAEMLLDRRPGEDWNFVSMFSSEPAADTTASGWGDWVELDGVRLDESRVTVRNVWEPAPELTAAERQEAIRQALAGETRDRVVEVPGGFQNVMDFRQLSTELSRVLVAHPDTDGVSIDVERLEGILEPFHPPAADVRDLSGSFRMRNDTLYVIGVAAALPDSRIFADGYYTLGSGNLAFDVKGEPVGLADLRWVYPSLPTDGGGALNLSFEMSSERRRIAAREIDLRIGESELRGELAAEFGDTLRLRDTNLHLARLDTRLIEQLAPGVELPRHGHLTGSLTVDGDPSDVRIDAGLSFDDEAGGSSHFFVEGGLAQTGLNVDDLQFRGMHLQLRPLQTDLLRALSPDLPLQGTIEGSALLAGSLQDGLQVDSDFVLHDARTGVSRISADGGVVSGEGVRVQGLHVQLDPIQLDLFRQDVRSMADGAAASGAAASGAVMLDGPLAGLLQVRAEIAIDDPASGVSRIEASGGVDVSETLRFQDLDLRADPMRVEFLHAFSPELPLGGVLEGSARIDGSPSSQLDVTADIVYLEAGERSHVRGGGTLELEPEARVDFDFELQPLSLRTAGLLAPGAGLRGAVEGELDVEGTVRDLRLDAALAVQDGGSLALAGRLTSGDLDTTYALNLSVRAFDPSDVTDRLPLEASLEGSLQADGRGLDPATMEATLAADLQDVAVDAYEADGVQLELRVDDGLVTASPASARLRSAVVELEGSFGIVPGRTGTLAYRLAVDSLHTLAPWIPAADTGIVAPRPAVREAAEAERERVVREAEVAFLATGRLPDVERDTLAALYLPRDSLSGSLQVEGVARGHLARFDVEGRATVDGLTYQGNYVGHGEIDYALTDASATTAATDSVELDEMHPAAAERDGAEHLDGPPDLMGRSGGGDEMHAEVDAAFETLLLSGYAIEAASITAEYDGGRGDGAGRRGAGELAVAIERDEASSLHLASEYVLALERNELRLSDFDVQLDSVRWSTVDTAAVAWSAGGLTIEEVDLRSSAGGRIFVDGDLPAGGAVELEALVSELDIAYVADLLQDDREAAGIFELDARIQGTQQAPRIQGQATLRRASVEGAAVPDADLDLSYEDDELHAVLDLMHGGREIGRAEARLPLSVSLAGDSPSLLERPMRVTFRGEQIPLGVLPALTDQVESVEGSVAVDVAITGTPGEPSAEGDLALGLESLHVVPLGVRFAPLTGHASLVDDVLRIDSVVAYTEGAARITGDVHLATLTSPSFDLEITARDTWVIDTEDAQLQVDADLTLDGPLDTLIVGGLVRTRQGVIYVPETSEFGAAEVVDLDDPATFERVDSLLVAQRDVVTGGTPALSRLQADLEVEIDRDVWLRSTEANVEIYTPSELGPLRIGLRGLQSMPTIEGTINTDRGEYEYMSRRFTLTRGAVTFMGGEEIDPMLQIAAEHEVQIPGSEALTIRILAGGSLRDPQITLESNAQPPISETDLLSYLAFGREASALIQGGGASLSGQASGSAGLVGNVAGLATQQFSAIALESMASGLEADVGRELGLDVIRIAPAHLPSDVFTGSYLDVLRGTEVEVGSYLGSRMFIAAQARPARAFPGLRFEYRTRRDFEWSATWRSRFVPQVPTLREREANSVGVFGSFLFKEWRF